MLLTEYRVILPVSVEEVLLVDGDHVILKDHAFTSLTTSESIALTTKSYQVAQLYSVAEASKNETGGGEGIEVRKNEPFSQFENCPKEPLFADNRIFIDGQYTHKIYYLQRKVPALIRVFAPSKSLEIHEEAWNAYPYCRTIITNPDYMKKDFILKIESMHLPDRGTTENAHNLSEEQLRHRKVCIIDIASDLLSSKDYKANEDPRKYRSEKTGRGPLEGNWIETVCPVMCAYKLVSVEFRWFGLQARIEELIMKQEKRLFTNFHRQVFCWTDKWHGLEMKDIRQLEDKTKDDLDQQLCDGQIRGTYTD